VFINRNSGIKRPQDLGGKIMGVPEYSMTAALWLRRLFEHDYGVLPGAMRWRVGGIEQPNRADRMNVTVNAQVEIEPIPQGKSLNGMLEAGEIDAMMSPRIPSTFRNKHPDVVRLFPNYHEDERAYYERIGFVPIMHTVVIKRAPSMSASHGSRRACSRPSERARSAALNACSTSTRFPTVCPGTCRPSRRRWKSSGTTSGRRD
jgi:4,5-dihydroxyphthalate decarboxylase